MAMSKLSGKRSLDELGEYYRGEHGCFYLNSPCVSEQLRKRIKREQKRRENPRVSFLAQEGVPYVGTVVGHDEYGEWRTVPGFPAHKLLASSMGYVRTRTGRGKSLGNPWKGKYTKGYRAASVDDHPYRVHLIILRAFLSPQPSHNMTGDHANGNKSDNCIENLTWLTPSEQRANQRAYKPRRDGKPIFVRHADWPSSAPALWFASATAAEKALGVKGLRRVADPNYPNHVSVCDKSGNRWFAKSAPALETQDDLTECYSVNCNGDTVKLAEEKWVDAYYYDDKPLHGWRVSNRGRAQRKNSAGDDWGYKFTPRPTVDEDYAMISDLKAFHIAVVLSFGVKIPEGYVVDHLDQDKTNNVLSNLQPKTHGDNMRNVTLKPISERNNSQKKPVEVRLKDDSSDTAEWTWYESVNAAARALDLNLGGIYMHFNGKCSHVCGWVFRRVE